MREKWRDERGETLVEVTASILIMTLAILMLFSTVMVSARINRSARELDKAFYNVLNRAERQGASDEAAVDPAASTVKVEQISPATGVFRNVTVRFYGGEGALSYSYPGS